MPPEFCLFVIGGKEMLLYLIGHREQSQDLLLCLQGWLPHNKKCTERNERRIDFQNGDN